MTDDYDWKKDYGDPREVPGHGMCGLHEYVYTWGLVTGLNDTGYSGRYCYEMCADAAEALRTWTGEGDPTGPWLKYKGRGGERIGPGCNIF
jgi:hypothetical protein